MMRHQSTALSHIIGFVLCFVGMNSYAAEPLAVKPVKIWTVPPAVQPIAIRFSAQLQASEHAQLAFPLMGQLQSLDVRMGQEVQAGQVLARLDPTDYQIQLDARKAEHQLANVRASRAKRLYAERLISEDDRDRAQTALTVASAQLEQAKTDLADTYLRAPFAGFVSFTHHQAHEVIPANKAVLNLMALEQLDVIFDLPNHYMQQVEQLDQVQFVTYFEGNTQGFRTRFKEADLQPDRDTNSYRITLTLPRPDPLNLLPGMAASVELQLPLSQINSWRLPQGAIVTQQGQTATVWQLDQDNTLQAVTVTLNANGEVSSGLQENMQIVAIGADTLSAGQKVRVWQREGGL